MIAPGKVRCLCIASGAWFSLVLLMVFLPPGLRAQTSLAPQPAASTREENSDDPLGRSTPRGTVLGFTRAANREDFDQAASYLDTQQRGDLARELAQHLGVILDREASIDLSELSRRPEGSLSFPQNPDRELVGVVRTSSGNMDIWLDRVRRGDNPPIWLFSDDTLALVAETYQEIGGAPEIARYLPSWLKAEWFSSRAWRLLIPLTLILLLGSLLVRLLKSLLTKLVGHFGGSTEIVQAQGLVAPLLLTLFGILVVIGTDSFTLLARSFSHIVGNLLIVFGVTWLSIRIVGIVGDRVLVRLRRVQAFDRIGLASLLRRLSQVAVLAIGVLIVLYLAGVNLTAALTGLGIGGVAVAFAAQNTLENLFGGIMIISDRPVRIGDACKVGDVTGVVVHVGLRSTRIRTMDRTIVTIPNGRLATMNLENYTLRDKFWFHPTIGLRYQTTLDQMQTVLHNIREMLDSHAKVESETARVRFIRIGDSSQDVEIFAYVFAADYSEFLGIQENLFLHVLEIVESAGTALALPTQVTHVVNGDGVNARRLQGKPTANGEH